MPKSDLIAVKNLRYATRRLSAGDLFQATPRHARLLIAIGKAEPANAVRDTPSDELAERIRAATKPADSGHETVVALRQEYERVTGKRVFTGWDAATLRAKIAQAG